MANETLSPSQAKSILNETEKIMNNLQNKILIKNNEFIEKLRQIWEDFNAVEFIKSHKINMESLLCNLGTNTSHFGDTVVDIANSYAKVGGNIISVGTIGKLIKPDIDISKVQDHFADGESGDEFGFRNPESGASQTMDAFNNLKNEISQLMTEAVSEINSINAFGNQNVKANLAKSAGKIVEICEEGIKTSENSIKNLIDQTAQSYIKLGTSAETAANLSSN